jgi:2,4-dienoyl-CoA reductase-like NADH-dependent reductase (Old Yellow Enzyme family)
MFMAKDGMANDFHLAHYANKAMGKVGLIVVEATGIQPNGRISPYCLGLWKDEQIEPLKRITKFIKEQGGVPAIQINHCGRRGSVNEPWNGFAPIPLEKGGFSLVAPSAIPYHKDALMPAEMNEKDILEIQEAFVNAAKRAIGAGFDAIEIHGAHGFLIHEFLSPVSNKRNDKYGGSLENRQRLLLEIAEKIRKVIPEDKILMVRMSCVDYISDGWKLEDTIDTVKKLKLLGVDILDCSSGGVASDYQKDAKPLFQVPYATAIKKATGMLVACVGLIKTPKQANGILDRDESDIVAIGREMLKNPNWTLDAAEILKFPLEWPAPLRQGCKSGNIYSSE